MNEKWKMYLLLIIPWLSIFKLGRNTFFRFMPTIVFSDLDSLDK